MCGRQRQLGPGSVGSVWGGSLPAHGESHRGRTWEPHSLKRCLGPSYERYILWEARRKKSPFPSASPCSPSPVCSKQPKRLPLGPRQRSWAGEGGVSTLHQALRLRQAARLAGLARGVGGRDRAGFQALGPWTWRRAWQVEGAWPVPPLFQAQRTSRVLQQAGADRGPSPPAAAQSHPSLQPAWLQGPLHIWELEICCRPRLGAMPASSMRNRSGGRKIN